MRNLEVAGLRKVGQSILVESSMVYLGPSLHSPKGALEFFFLCELCMRDHSLSIGINLLSRLMRATQARYN